MCRNGIVVLLTLMAGGLRAQDDAKAVLEQALDLLDSNNARQAVAVLAVAARSYPQDRKIGGMLYTLLRDKRWPIEQTLPLKLSSAVTVLRWNPDGNWVIAGTEDGTVRILDADTGKLFDARVKHPGAVIGVAILLGNELAFSVGKAGFARIWKISDGKIVREWRNPKSAFTAYAITKDGKRVALGYENGEVRVYDRESGKQVGEPVHHSKAITGLVFSQDDQLLATASADGTSRVWDLATGKPRDFTIKHKAPLVSVDLKRLGIYVLTASEDGIAKVSNMKDGSLIAPEVDCGAGIIQARLGSSGIYFSTVLTDHTVRIWESTTGKPAEGVIRTDEGILSADWGPAGISMVTACEGQIAHIWRVRNGRRVTEGMPHESSVRVAAYGENSRRIATGCADGTLQVWRVDVGAATPGMPSIRAHDAPVRTAFFSADGKGLVSCSHDLTTIRWKMESVAPLGRALPYDGDPVCTVYSPDRSFVATVTEDGKAFVVDGPSGEAHGAPRDLGAPGRWVDFHKDGKRFLTTAGTKAVVWSVDEAAPVATIEHPGAGGLRMARFSPDGRFIATAGEDGTARIWDTATRKEIATLKRHEGAVTGVRFSLNGKLLVTAGVDGLVSIWDTATWKPTGATIILPGEVFSAIIGPNNQFVAASSQLSDGVRFFDIETGRDFQFTIETPGDAVSIDLHPSGDALAIACADGNVRTYGAPFVEEDIPKWMPEFAERIIGMRMEGPDKFVRVHTTYQGLQQYPPPGTPPDSDFGRLAKWSVTYGIDRTMAPRSFATIESNVVARVAERSLDALYEIFEAQPANPLIFAAMSLYVPTQRQGEFLADYALERSEKYPLAKAYVASTHARWGHMDEAERVMQLALAAAPNDPRVLRRAAKLDARQGRKEAAIAKLEKAVAGDPEDQVTYRDYGWILYNLDEPAKALEQFKKADGLAGSADPDIGAGVCLADVALGNQAEATARYQRLIKIAAEWGEADYVKNLTGWTQKELTEMERLRALATAKR